MSNGPILWITIGVIAVIAIKLAYDAFKGPPHE